MHWASCARRTLVRAHIHTKKAVETYEVRVHVRPAGHDVAVGDVDLLRALDVEARADGEDLAVLDGDIAHEGGSALRTETERN